MFKYSLDKLVYYLQENKLHSAKILSRIKVENLYDDKHTEMYNQFKCNGIFYATCHGIFEEERIFNSKEELAKYIIES